MSTSTITMKTNMALALLLSGAALLLLEVSNPRPWRRYAGGCAGAAVFLIGALTLYEHLFRQSLGIDQLIFTEPPGAAGILSPNRMGPPGAISLVLIGSALVSLVGRRRTVTPHLGLLVCFVALVPAVGYLYGARAFYGNAYFTVIAWPTIPALMALGIGLVLACPETGPMPLLLREDAGGALLRHLLPATLVIPVVLGYVRTRGEMAGLYGPATGRALLVLSLIVTFSGLLWISATRLSRIAADERAGQEALRSSEQRFRAFVEASSDIVYSMNADWSELRRLDGKGFLSDTQSPSGEWLRQYLEPDDRSEVVTAIQKAIQTKRVYELEHRVRRADGSIGWALSRAVPILNDRHEIVEWFGTAIDVSARKAAEIRLQEALEHAERSLAERNRLTAALRESEARFRAVAENVPEMIWVVNADSNYLYLSPRWLEYTGTSTAQNANNGWLALLHPEDRDDAAAAWRTAVESGSSFEAEYRLQRHDGQYRWQIARAVPVPDTNSDRLLWFGTTTDIEEQKLAQELLIRNEKLASAGRMAATVAHEINNPLATVTNLLYLLRKDVSSESGQQLLSAAEAELAQVGQITRQTLGFYRDSSKPVRFKVADLLDEILTSYKGKLRRSHITVSRHYDSADEVEALRGEMRQVFSNLIANAIDAMPEGGTLELGISRADTDGRHAVQEIQVRDTGTGIDEDNRTKIFEPFFTTKQDVGTGLGLWVVKEILKRHGGTVDLSSSTDPHHHGTCFSVRVPARWEFRLV